MKILILVDYKVANDTKFWMKIELLELGHEVKLKGISDYNDRDRTSKAGKLKLWFKYFKLSVAGIRATGKGDVMVSWNFVVGAIAAFLCKIFAVNRRIISLNMIAHEKDFLNSVLRKVIYNLAFRNKNFWISVNDQQLIGIYSKNFNFPEKRIFVLHDTFYDHYEQSDFNDEGNFVFSGGDAYRDWNSFIRCATEMPGLQFVGVARKKNFPPHRKLPDNLRMLFDIPQDEFNSHLKKSKIVFLPLNSIAPCGLIVMIRAALLSKPVIITDTPSTKNYIKNDVSGRLIKINDVSGMKDSISLLNQSAPLRLKYADNLKKHLLMNFSTRTNARIINEIILNKL
jgi:glycosyltransferase involved in cell wall biosynthesis